MTRLAVPPRLAVLVLALVVPLLVGVAPAHADPQQTPIVLTVQPDREEDTTIQLAAYVQNGPATGTFTYRDADGTAIGTGPALPGGGTYPVVVPKPAGPTTFTVDFTSDDPSSWSDATASLSWAAAGIRTVVATPQPTIINLNGLVPTLTLTLAVSFKLRDGTGVPGMRVYHYMLCDPGPNRYCGLHVPLCEAVSDASGLATCKGTGTVGALVSILGGNVIQTIASEPVSPTQRYHLEWKPRTFPVIG